MLARSIRQFLHGHRRLLQCGISISTHLPLLAFTGVELGVGFTSKIFVPVSNPVSWVSSFRKAQVDHFCRAPKKWKAYPDYCDDSSRNDGGQRTVSWGRDGWIRLEAAPGRRSFFDYRRSPFHSCKRPTHS